MKVQAIGEKILTNKKVLKGLEKISEHGASFAATTAFVMSAGIRPLAIMFTPDTEKENKQYAASKSIASGLIKFAMIEAVALPLEYAVQKIDADPKKYLKSKTIDNLLDGSSELSKSKSYKFLTQIIKQSAGLLTAIPKSVVAISLIPIIVDKVFGVKPQQPSATVNDSHKTNTHPSSNPFFTGRISQYGASGIGKLLDLEGLQKFANKYKNKDSDITKHMTAATDVLLTATAVQQIQNNSKIKENRKKVLIYNNIITTAITLAGGYLADGVVKKRTEKFVNKFKMLNREAPNLAKCVEGINILRPILIFAGIYYAILPIFSTYISEKIDKFVGKGHG